MLEFKKLTVCKEGSVFSLLERSYERLIKEKPELAENWQKDWEQYDREVFQFPETIGAAGFSTWINENIIGFGSYDPRQRPELGIIGHNCILPELRGKGFGKAQILEIVNIFKQMGVKKVKVTTGEHPFFISAQRMYISCGFKESQRYIDREWDFRQIEYTLVI